MQNCHLCFHKVKRVFFKCIKQPRVNTVGLFAVSLVIAASGVVSTCEPASAAC